jgi:hypothetical protein
LRAEIAAQDASRRQPNRACSPGACRAARSAGTPPLSLGGRGRAVKHVGSEAPALPHLGGFPMTRADGP